MEEIWELQFNFDNGCTYTILTDESTVERARQEWSDVSNCESFETETLLREVRMFKGFRVDVTRREAFISFCFRDLTALSAMRVL